MWKYIYERVKQNSKGKWKILSENGNMAYQILWDAEAVLKI